MALSAKYRSKLKACRQWYGLQRIYESNDEQQILRTLLDMSTCIYIYMCMNWIKIRGYLSSKNLI